MAWADFEHLKMVREALKNKEFRQTYYGQVYICNICQLNGDSFDANTSDDELQRLAKKHNGKTAVLPSVKEPKK